MTPGGAAGAETDGEGPLKHSVMKRFAVNSLIPLAFQMNPARVPCLIYFRNSHLMCFYKCLGRAAADATFFKLFGNMTSTWILGLGEEGGEEKDRFPLQPGHHFHMKSQAKRCAQPICLLEKTEPHLEQEVIMRLKTSYSHQTSAQRSAEG